MLWRCLGKKLLKPRRKFALVEGAHFLHLLSLDSPVARLYLAIEEVI
jgi:hypothetical protein